MKIISSQTLAEACYQQAEKFKDKPAFCFEDQEITFHQFNLNSNKVANGLLRENIKPQSRVAYLGKDSINGYEIFFGCAKAKAVLVPINWRLAAKEIQYILNDSGVEILFVSLDLTLTIKKILAQLKTVRKVIVLDDAHPEWISYTNWCSQQSNHPLTLKCQPEEAVVHIYTSGTTGHPKGVLLPNYSFLRLMDYMKDYGDDWMNLNKTDTLLLSLPIFHVGGLWWTIQGFIAGSRGVILESFIANKALALIEKYKVTKLGLVPAMIQFMLAESNIKKTNLSSIKGLVYGGAPIAPKLLQAAMETFKCDFFQVYGLTETGNMAVCLRPHDHTLKWDDKMKAAGKPLPGVRIRINGPKNNRLKTKTIGEICLQSPSNMIGYWKSTTATNQTLRDGWVHTGDAGYIDEDGYLYVCDRIKDMIIYAGENIYPAEIEAVLMEHPSIAEVAIIGIENDRWGEIVKAFIVLKPDCRLKKIDIITFLKTRIASFKIPKSFSFVKALPRNPSGKILKRTLRDSFSEKKKASLAIG